jgi:signal peptidase I
MTYINSESVDQQTIRQTLTPTRLDHLGSFLKYFVIVFSIISIGYGMIKWGISEKVRVEGNSMIPYLQDQQEVIIEKFVSKFSGFKRGQIIVISDRNKLIIKRVIGLSNETIELKNRNVYIYNNQNQNGIKLEEDYIGKDGNQTIYPTCKIPDCRDEYENVKIGSNELYVMGDNRIDSRDSRSYGAIDKGNVIGILSEIDIKNKTKFVLPTYNISNL